MVKVKLIDKYLPGYTFNEYHETVINSSIDEVYETAKNFDLSKSTLIKRLFKIRGGAVGCRIWPNLMGIAS